MTLNYLLDKFVCDADINVLDPDEPSAVVYIPGEGAVIPKPLRKRQVLRFEIETITLDNESFQPMLVVWLKGAKRGKKK